MDARGSSILQLPNWINPKKIARKPASSLQFFQKYGMHRSYHMSVYRGPLAKEQSHGFASLKVLCSAENRQGRLLEHILTLQWIVFALISIGCLSWF